MSKIALRLSLPFALMYPSETQQALMELAAVPQTMRLWRNREKEIGSFIICCDIMLPHSGNRSHASTKGVRSRKTPCKMKWKLLEKCNFFFFFFFF